MYSGKIAVPPGGGGIVYLNINEKLVLKDRLFEDITSGGNY
jgi:hypothetical protein